MPVPTSIVQMFDCSNVLLAEPHDTHTFGWRTNRAVAVFFVLKWFFDHNNPEHFNDLGIWNK